MGNNIDYKTIMLIVTENCNLKCTYCYETDKTSKTMLFETAKKIIAKEFGNQYEFAKGEIEIFGGEAFLNFELIKEIYEYALTTYPNIDFVFTNTTNGTLIHGDIQKWLYDRRNKFFCTLSLDGTKEMHDQNRPYANGWGSYDTIDIDFFLNTWEHCGAKMTISDENIENLADGIMHIESLGFDCMATFASGIDWNLRNKREILIREFSKLVDYYSENPTRRVCQLLNYDFRYIFYPLDDKFRYCGAGVIKKCYDINGNVYPCQGLSALTVGEKAVNFINKDFKDFHLSDNNPCKKCKWIRLCRTCYAANFLETGNVETNCQDICYLNRLSILASSKIQFNRLLRQNSFNDDERMILKAIEIIQEEIFKE